MIESPDQLDISQLFDLPAAERPAPDTEQITYTRKKQRQDKLALQKLQAKYNQRERILRRRNEENVALQRRLKDRQQIRSRDDRKRSQLQPKVIRNQIKNEVVQRVHKM